MNLEQRENEIKLEMLESLSRSQRALAKILESIADVTGSSDRMALKMREHVKELSRYQRVLAGRIIPSRARHIHKGKPADPWFPRN